MNVILHSKRDSEDVIKAIETGELCLLSRRAQCNHRSPYKRKTGGSESERVGGWKQSSEREIRRCYAVGLEDGGRGPGAKECR